MKQVQTGFTLIELMIVVAIIGILAAVAIPAYQDYTTRAKVSECVAALAACKTSVAEYYASQAALPTSTDAAGCSTNTSQYCSAITVGNGGAITLNIQDTAGVPSACALTLTPTETAAAAGGTSGGLSWAGTTGCDKKYVPANFRS